MAEPLKNIYSEEFIDRFSETIKIQKHYFDKRSFVDRVFTADWANMELKERMRHITMTIHEHLQGNYENQISFMLTLIPALKNNGFKADSFAFFFIADFVEVFGVEHYDVSIKAIEEITQFVTCEFAIRPFLIEYKEKTMQQMNLWAKHNNASVRRLATEGCRSRLPWAIGVPYLKQEPELIFPILECLKNDPSETVRRSVANNLNDISKDHPEQVVSFVKQWKGESDIVDKMLKHACRTLLKQGNPEVMQLFGFGAIDDIEICAFTVQTPKVKIGDTLDFSFDLKNNSSHSKLLRLEYAIYYLRLNRSHSKKVFKISEKEYKSQSIHQVQKKQSFRIITTRKFYPGNHFVSIIVNGNEIEKLDFELVF